MLDKMTPIKAAGKIYAIFNNDTYEVCVGDFAIMRDRDIADVARITTQCVKDEARELVTAVDLYQKAELSLRGLRAALADWKKKYGGEGE